MSDETKVTEPSADAAAPIVEDNDNIIESFGRKFDITKPQERRDLKIWTEAIQVTNGRLGNEVGKLREEVKPLRKYNIKGANADEAAIAKQVSELQAQGEYQQATALMFEYSRQVSLDADAKLEETRLWSDYVKQNPKIFEVLDEDVMKDYVMRNYRSELQAAEDPLSLIDRVVKPKVKIAPVADAVVPASLGASGAVAPKGEVKPKDDETKGYTFADIEKEFNFK